MGKAHIVRYKRSEHGKLFSFKHFFHNRWHSKIMAYLYICSQKSYITICCFHLNNNVSVIKPIYVLDNNVNDLIPRDYFQKVYRHRKHCRYNFNVKYYVCGSLSLHLTKYNNGISGIWRRVILHIVSILFIIRDSTSFIWRKYMQINQAVSKSRSCEFGCYIDRFALQFDRHLGSTIAKVPVKF